MATMAMSRTQDPTEGRGANVIRVLCQGATSNYYNCALEFEPHSALACKIMYCCAVISYIIGPCILLVSELNVLRKA